MTKQLLSALPASAFLLLCSPAVAQEQRFEVNPHYGFRWGGGLDVNNQPAPGIPAYRRVELQSSGAYGIGGGFYVSENFMIDFDWSRQSTKIDATRTNGAVDTNIADFNMDTYHFGFNYHFLDPEQGLRPFIRFGMGWTASRPDISGVDTFNRFSGSIGAGVKYFFTPNIGVNTQIRWMPTYVYSEPGGMWCGWYACWLVPDNHYLQQGDISVGASFRF
jgi:opacity protein-like surface antigen